MISKVTGLHLSIRALKTLKYYCILHELSMSKVVEDLILTYLQLPGFINPEAEENTSESE